MAALMFSGQGVLIVGVEENEAGGVKVFVDHRSRGLYFVVRNPEGAEQVRRAWRGSISGHLIVDRRDVGPLISSYDTVAARLRQRWEWRNGDPAVAEKIGANRPRSIGV